MRYWLVFLLLTNPAYAVNYYVATTGDDNNPGTQALPWRTIQHAEEQINAGDVAIVADGDYRSQGRITLNRSGNATSGLIFLRAQNAREASVKGFDIQGASYVRVDGFTVIDMGNMREGQPPEPGVYVANSSYCWITGNAINYNTLPGIFLDDRRDSASVSNCVVDGNSFYRNAQAGVEVHGRNHTIQNNKFIETIDHHPCDPNYPDYYDADGIRAFGSGHVIENNEINATYGVNPSGTTPPAGCSIAALNDPANDFIGNSAHPDCIQTWNGSGYEVLKNTVIRGNICHAMAYNPATDGPASFLMLELGPANINIYNNAVDATFIAYIDRGTGFRFENNTFVSNEQLAPYGGLGIQLSKSPGAVVRNNIFAHINGDSARYVSYQDNASQKGAVVDYNCVDRAGSPKGAHDVRGAPQFVKEAKQDYHLRATSPCKDSGLTIPTITTDKDGISRPQGPAYDMGAYEYH